MKMKMKGVSNLWLEKAGRDARKGVPGFHPLLAGDGDGLGKPSSAPTERPSFVHVHVHEKFDKMAVK
jgi:hypothetical protein